MKFKPYEEYRDAEYEWLGIIPRHWRTLPIKSITEIKSIRQKDIDIKFNLLSVYRDFGVIRRSSKDNNHNIIPEDLSNYKIVNKGDLVLNKMKVWQGSLGISEYQGIVSPAYIVCNITCEINKKYLNYLLRNRLYLTIYNQLSYGVRVDQWDIRYNDFKDIKILFPPKEEQDKIVEFLDDKLEKIDKFIELREEQIELFQEEKEVLINDAVTKGIDKSVKYKDSGMDWVGGIPEHWEVIRLKYLVDSNLISLSNNEEKDKEIEYIDIGSVGFFKLKSEPVKMLFGQAPSRARRIIKNGDIIISTVRTYLKSMLYIDEGLTNKIVSTGFSVLTPKKDIDSNYLKYSISGNYLIQNIIKDSAGVAYPAINDDRLMSQKIVYCRNKKEQKQIVAHIENETSKIDKTIDLYKKQIDLIKEYRTSLISQAVTGKIDVRSFQGVG